jgi:septal ring factor EnvC (AmiA/AmiB activator)
MTLLSRNAKKTMQSGNTQKSSLSFVNENDFSKIQPKMAESEVRENTILKELEDSNKTLRDQLIKMADEKEKLEKELKNLKRDLEDMELSVSQKDKWRQKALDLEDSLDQLETNKRKNKREMDGLKDQIKKMEEELNEKNDELGRVQGELKGVKQRVQDSNGELNDLLKGLQNSKGDENENRDLLKEVVKKVDELTKKSIYR